MREVDMILSGALLLTMDDRNTQIDHGAIAIKGDIVVGIGSREEIHRLFISPEEIHESHGLIMPGLINCHTHAAMTCFRGMADDMALMDWLNHYIFPAEAKNVNPDLAYWGSMLACAEMIRAGTTTFSDMYIFEDETGQAAKKAGMRCLIGEVLFDFPSPNVKSPAEGLTYTRKLLNKWADDPLVSIMVEPHALYTCSTELLKDAKAIADEFQVPYAIHLLENKAEVMRIREKFGMNVGAFLQSIDFLTERFFAFHCVYMNEQDIQLFADHGCKVVHNPESNMKLASGVAPISSMLKHGIVVGLGTDGCASNNNLNMFEEMDTAAKLAKVESLDPTVMSARTVVRMATCDGAKVLGMGNRIGSLEGGKKADVIMIDMRKPHLTPMYHSYSHLAYTVSSADVDTVIINGRLVMRKRELLTIDADEAMDQVNRIAIGIRESMNL
ncbi:MAG: amidohydrolase [Syntrophales bacterium]